jgi:hypothetical protein
MTTDQFVKEFSSVTKAMAEQSQRVDKSWWGISRSVDHIGETFEKSWSAAISRQFGKQGTIMTGLDQLSKFIRDPKSFDGATKAMSADAKALKAQIKFLNERKKDSTASAEELAELATAKESLKIIGAKLPLMKQLNKIKFEGLTYVPALLGSLKDTVKFSDQIQASLIQANSALGERYRLMKDIAAVQRSTGASAETLAEATAAATKYGLEMRPTFKEDLDLIVKMKEGMGVAAENSANLFATVRSMGQSTKDVADSIARVKADTGLAADEAARLYKEIAKTMAIMAPGGNIGKVAEVVGKLEGAAVEVGLGSGEISKMLVGWTKMSGLMSVGMLGLQPDVLKDEATAMMAFGRMVEFTEKALRGLEPGQAMHTAQIEMLSKTLGISTDVIARGRATLNKYNETVSTTTTLQQEWQKQTSSFSKSWDKLKNQFAGLIHGVLLPLVEYLQTAVDWATKVVTTLTESETALWGFRAAFAGAFGHTLYKIVSIITKLSGLAGPIGKMAAYLPAFGKFFGMFSGLASSGVLQSLSAAFGGVAVVGGLSYSIGRLILSNTRFGKSIDNYTQSLFEKKLFGITKTGPTPGGPMQMDDWWKNIRQLRSDKEDERDVFGYAMANLKNVDQIVKATPEDRWKLADSIAQQYFHEGRLRQRQAEIGALPGTTKQAALDAGKQTEILGGQEALKEMQMKILSSFTTLLERDARERSSTSLRKDLDRAKGLQPTGMKRGSL